MLIPHSSRIYRLVRNTILDFIPFLKNRKLYKETNNTLKGLTSQWAERLNKKPFHGGETPDAADFKLYSIVKKFETCSKLRFKLNNTKTPQFEDWYAKMKLLCTRSAHYNIKQVTYSYNPTMNEEVREENQLNKQAKTSINSVFSDRRKKINMNI